MNAADVRVDRLDVRRIGLLSDTHVQQHDAADLPATTLKAFKSRGVELIVHCGHYGNPGIFTKLSKVAPVLAVQTALDERQNGDRLASAFAGVVHGHARVLECGGVRAGVIFDLSGKGFDI